MYSKLWEHYSKKTYDRVENPEEEELEDMLVMRMNHIPTTCRSILDAGCSVGWTTNWLRQNRDAIAWGITYNPADVKEATRRGFRGFVFEGDVHDLHMFESEKFDCVFCSHVLEHVLAPHVVLCEFNRLLCQDGSLILILPDEHWKQSYKNPAHVNWWDPDQLIFFVQTRGFRLIDSWQEATNVRTKYGARGNDVGMYFEKAKAYEGIVDDSFGSYKCL